MANGQITVKNTTHTKNSLHTKIVTYIEQVRVRTFSPPVVDHRLATHMRSDALTQTIYLEV